MITEKETEFEQYSAYKVLDDGSRFWVNTFSTYAAARECVGPEGVVTLQITKIFLCVED